jgi:oligosaccharide repeat unit polymerase
VEYIPLRLETWALLAANLLAFGFGWLLAHMLCGPAKPIVTAEFTRSSVSEEKFQKCIYGLFMLGMVGAANFLWAIQRSMGLSTYLTSASDIREAMGLGDLAEGLKPLNWLNVANVVLCGFYLMILRGKRRKSIWVVLVLSLMATLIMEDRQRFFYAVLWASFVLAYSRKWTRREMLFAASGVVAVLLIQFLAVATWLGKVTENNPGLVAAANVSETFHPLLTPYIYLTANFPALQEYISSSPERTNGALSFYPVVRAAQLIDPSVRLPQVIGDFYAVPFDFNTFTWLYNFYTDFGVAGVVAGPWLVGLLSGLAYSRMRYSMSFYALYVSGLLSFGFAFSCFTNQFVQGPMWFFLAVGVPIAGYVRCPEFQSSLYELA